MGEFDFDVVSDVSDVGPRRVPASTRQETPQPPPAPCPDSTPSAPRTALR